MTFRPHPKPEKRTKKPKQKIKPKSKKREKEERIYKKLSDQYKADHPVCEAKLTGCKGQTTEIHHKAGRGIYYLVVRYFLGVCRNCHRQITDNSKMAYEKGLSIK